MDSAVTHSALRNPHSALETMYDLTGKVAVVTGSGRRKGIGEAVVRRLAAEGCAVVLSDLGRAEGERFSETHVGTSDEMEAIAAEVRQSGAEVLAVPCDVRDEGSVEALMQAAVDAFGRLDVLVNNAGVGYLMGAVTEVSLDDWDAVLQVNLRGPFLGTKYAARHMIERGEGGRIVNVASQAAKSGFAFAAAYTSSKHGLVGLTRSTAIELAPHQITVNAVCPNHITTGLGDWQNSFFSDAGGQSYEDYLQGIRDRIPLGRVGQVDDIAKAVAWLASDQAGYVTGEAMNVSGGEETH